VRAVPDGLPQATRGGFDRLYGALITAATPELVTAEVAVSEALYGAAGTVHGGVLTALAESAAVAGTELGAAAGDASAIRAISTVTSVLSPVAAGTLYARAVRRHAGRTTWVWEVELAGDDGRACGVTRVTVAVRPA
jgi:uncharacterized protein (TIGR00369 family)